MKTRMSDETSKRATHLHERIRLNILLVSKVKIRVRIKWSYNPHPSFDSLFSLERLSYFELITQSIDVFLVSVLGATLNHTT